MVRFLCFHRLVWCLPELPDWSKRLKTKKKKSSPYSLIYLKRTRKKSKSFREEFQTKFFPKYLSNDNLEIGLNFKCVRVLRYMCRVWTLTVKLRFGTSSSPPETSWPFLLHFSLVISIILKMPASVSRCTKRDQHLYLRLYFVHLIWTTPLIIDWGKILCLFGSSHQNLTSD